MKHLIHNLFRCEHTTTKEITWRTDDWDEYCVLRRAQDCWR